MVFVKKLANTHWNMNNGMKKNIGFADGVLTVGKTSSAVFSDSFTHLVMVYVQYAVITTVVVREVVAVVTRVAAQLPVITTIPTIHGQDVPTNTVRTAVSIWVLEQVTVTPIPHGVAVLGTNTAMIAVHI